MCLKRLRKWLGGGFWVPKYLLSGLKEFSKNQGLVDNNTGSEGIMLRRLNARSLVYLPELISPRSPIL